MNYYMPYFNMSPSVAPMISRGASRGLFSRLFSGINWSSILSNTQKTLGIVNQAIPMVKQISPIMKNAKTMFKVMNEFKKVDFRSPDKKNKSKNENEKKIVNSSKNNIIDDIHQTTTFQNFDGGPVFFVK